MKIRIKGNSIRLRLSRQEVDTLAVRGYLEEHTSFGEHTFVYALQNCLHNELSADFEDGKMTVFIPEAFSRQWADNEVIGLDAYVQVNDEEQLYLVVEKDIMSGEVVVAEEDAYDLLAHTYKSN